MPCLKGKYTGSDTILVADAPYDPGKCKELNFLNYSKEKSATSARPNRAVAGLTFSEIPLKAIGLLKPRDSIDVCRWNLFSCLA
jgi:hypothetical protein